MKKIIHLSDTHVGYPDLAERFATLATEIAFLKEPAEDYVIVITGDLVDSATADHYEMAATVIERLKTHGFTVLVCPGNHDYGTGSLGSSKWVQKFKRCFFEREQVTYPKLDLIDEVAFLGLDSMAEELHWYDALWANGELGEAQLGRLQAMLDDPQVAGCRKRVVYLHHHPFDPRLLHELKDAQRLGAVIQERVDCLLYGHNHEGKVRNGKWDIARCYDAGSSTHKLGSNGFYRVIDLDRPPRQDYDAAFI